MPRPGPEAAGFSPSPDVLRECYRRMALARRLDADAVTLHRQGVIVSYPPLRGQEAAQVASVLALRPTDYVFPSYRELGAAVGRGVDLVGFLRSNQGQWDGGLYDCAAHRFAPICTVVGGHVLHAVGWAMGRRKDGAADVAIAYFGDGAASEGDVAEALNFAGVFRAAVIFLCQNNGWAISVPAARQTAGEIWRRAEGYGFPGVRVDGNNAEAVYAAVAEAAARARRGDGPTLIEARTYRLAPHSTADDPTRYRSPAELAEWEARDPLPRLRRVLEVRGLVDDGFFERADRDAAATVAGVRRGLEEATPLPPVEMFDHAFAAPPARVRAQRAELAELLADA